MEEINIKSEGIILTEAMRKYLVDQLNTVFGFNKKRIKKIFIKILEDKESQTKTAVSCRIKIYIEGHPVISTELKTLDIYSAISLAIERANLKISRRLSDKRIHSHYTMLNHNSRLTHA